MPTLKQGALTRAELQGIWQGASDPGYTQPFLEAGDGEGMEAWSQYFAQLDRTSKAIDVTTQAMFCSPWSGQTNDSASSASKATVTLTLSRTKLLERALHLAPGDLVVGEETIVAGDNGGTPVLTGRRYFLAQDVVLFPGVAGPIQANFVAEFEGYGFDNPVPSSISAFSQPGAGFNNDLARVVRFDAPVAVSPPGSSAIVTADNQADMFVPDHIGQQVLFTAGTNAGIVGRVVRFLPPALPLGSAVELERFWAVSGVGSGSFILGELVNLKNGVTLVATGRFVAGTTSRFAFVLLSGGTITAGTTIATGAVSGATFTINLVLTKTDPVAEAPSGGVGGASWKVLSWEDDWGLQATNLASPIGGKIGMLDELGAEKNLGRSSGEIDADYARRIREIDDVVSPNAIVRAVARTWSNAFLFLEAGTTWQGFYYDGTLESPIATPGRAACDAYDTDVLLIAGLPAVGSIQAGEPAVLEDLSLGFYAGGYATVTSGTTLTFVRTSGRNTRGAGPFRVRGLHSGATFTVSTSVEPATNAALRHHTYLDYEQMRAFFWIELAGLALGEFGMAYDSGSADAYDTGFYDGFPAGAAVAYSQVYQAVDSARAGGVGFQFLRMDEEEEL